ncbi:MAG TPA: ABC transporter permease [Alphaproteobacteria bacterium]|nr:ABC transporter permease [Alphaproteobacteria bacterium]
MRIARPIIIIAGLGLIWAALVWVLAIPRFILPGPLLVLEAWWENFWHVLYHAQFTAIEIIGGLALGASLGTVTALTMAYFGGARRWLLPVLVASQAVPVFALAPILVLWLGYGMASKIAMAMLIIYFPVTAAFFDGLRRTDPGWLDLAHVMGGSRWAMLTTIRIPAALPALASGLRVAAAVAPIGAVVGEWVGSSVGLGHLMLHSNARVQVPLMFAALFTLILLSLTLYYTVDAVLRRALAWQPESNPADDR